VAIDYHTLRNWRIPDIARSYDHRDTIIYALGLGLGQDPNDANQLRFVLEDRLCAMPAMAIVLAYPADWFSAPGTGVDYSRVVHAEQSFTIHRKIPVAANVLGQIRVTDIYDKGADVGALMCTECEITDQDSGELLCTLTSSSMARADGGFGGQNVPSKSVAFIPQEPPHASCDIPTAPQAALIYRLSGDLNPLHCDPEPARRSGFDRAILHGRCTFGIACWALVRTCCDYDQQRLQSMSVRFCGPVYPGETLRTEIWRQGQTVNFRTWVVERNALVLSHGQATILPAAD